jgi:hypothetical protein
MESKDKDKPVVVEVFADNGGHSHYALVEGESGKKLWSEDPVECKSMGYPVVSDPDLISRSSVIAELEGMKVERDNIIKYEDKFDHYTIESAIERITNLK